MRDGDLASRGRKGGERGKFSVFLARGMCKLRKTGLPGGFGASGRIAEECDISYGCGDLYKIRPGL
jgi:hypothetical protein